MSYESSRHVSVYPVGLLADLLFLRNAIRHGHARAGFARLRYGLGHLRRRIRARDWRAVRNYFNGYLAEHEYAGYRAGHAWSKRRALRDLEQHLREVAR